MQTVVVKLQITNIMVLQISSQGTFNRFSIDRLYLRDEIFHHNHCHQDKNKNDDDHEDVNNNNNISVRFEICAKGNEDYSV